MWLRSSSRYLDGYGCKIRKESRCRPRVWNEIILTTRQEFSLTKVALVQTITDIALLKFWLMLLSWMFIPYCSTIYFFIKNLFFRMFIFQWLRYLDFFICILVEKRAMNQVRTQLVKKSKVRSGEGGVTPHVYVRTYASLFMVLAAFLSLFCHLFYLQKFSLTFS